VTLIAALALSACGAGNVIYDPTRGTFWAAVVNESPPDQLVQIDPVGKKVTTRTDGCGSRRRQGNGSGAIV